MPRAIPQLRDPLNWTLIPNRPVSERKAPYFMCGLGGRNRNGESMDVLDTLASLSPSSIKLFRAMVQARARGTNIVDRDDLIDGLINARYVQNHMPALVDCDLVRRVKRGEYMINPDAVMLPNGEAAREQWLSLAQKEAPPLREEPLWDGQP
jgi:hypothetical protein